MESRGQAAFFAVVFFALIVRFFLPPPGVLARLSCSTATKSITFDDGFFGFGFSSISSPPDSTFSSITSRSASR